MPRNNSDVRKAKRQVEAELRAEENAASGKSVAQREAERGYPAKLNAEGDV